MADDLRCYRIFIASPGGLQEEREAFRTAVQSYNDGEAIPRRVLFRPLGWEDTLGGMGRPQSIINEEFQQSLSIIIDRPRVRLRLPDGVSIAEELNDLKKSGEQYRLRPITRQFQTYIAVRLSIDPSKIDGCRTSSAKASGMFSERERGSGGGVWRWWYATSPSGNGTFPVSISKKVTPSA